VNSNGLSSPAIPNKIEKANTYKHFQKTSQKLNKQPEKKRKTEQKAGLDAEN